MPVPIKSFAFAVVFLIACLSGDIKPVPIEDGDMCSLCRMAISEKQFAAEMITDDERVLKFDDIGCLLRYSKAGKGQFKAMAIFVTDYDSRQWLKAEKAIFVRSKNIKTPMASGIVAYGDKSKAGSEGVRFDALTAAE